MKKKAPPHFVQVLEKENKELAMSKVQPGPTDINGVPLKKKKKKKKKGEGSES